MSKRSSGGEPTEQPTPKKLRDARRRGQIPRSAELGGFAVFAAVAGTLAVTGAGMATTLARFTRDCIRGAPSYGAESAWAVLHRAVSTIGWVLGPALLAAVLAALVSGSVQARGLLTFKPLAPKLERLNLMRGLRQIFGLRKLVDTARLLLGLAALAAVVWTTLAEALPSLLRLSGARPETLATELTRWCKALAWRGGLVLAVAATVDYALARRRHTKDLMMTKE